MMGTVWLGVISYYLRREIQIKGFPLKQDLLNEEITSSIGGTAEIASHWTEVNLIVIKIFRNQFNLKYGIWL